MAYGQSTVDYSVVFIAGSHFDFFFIFMFGIDYSLPDLSIQDTLYIKMKYEAWD